MFSSAVFYILFGIIGILFGVGIIAYTFIAVTYLPGGSASGLFILLAIPFFIAGTIYLKRGYSKFILQKHETFTNADKIVLIPVIYIIYFFALLLFLNALNFILIPLSELIDSPFENFSNKIAFLAFGLFLLWSTISTFKMGKNIRKSVNELKAMD